MTLNNDKAYSLSCFISERALQSCWDFVPQRHTDIALRVSRDTFEECFADIAFWNCRLSIGECFLITVKQFSDYIYAEKHSYDFSETICSTLYWHRNSTLPLHYSGTVQFRGHQNVASKYAPTGVCDKCNHLRL